MHSHCRMIFSLVAASASLLVPAVCRAESITTTLWKPLEIDVDVSGDYDWWELPVEVQFFHAASQSLLTLTGFSHPAASTTNGVTNRYVVRFAATLVGEWKYEARHNGTVIDGVSGTIDVRAPTSRQTAVNPNLRGHLKLSQDGRRFEHADGTPFFLLADTAWSINTLRCGLGTAGDGPFYRYLADRKSKNFTTLLISAMRGFGDTKEPHGQANEGGYPFVDGDTSKLNEAYFAALDRRMDVIWENGFAVAMHPAWFGKLNCFFDHETALRISQYLVARYGAYNCVWSLSGEYQYAMRDCDWTDDQINQLGNAVADVNAYRHPLSIHPSGRSDWEGQHGLQSSRAFHESGWLDHHWLQTGQKVDTMHLVPKRTTENRVLVPHRPVFLAEAYYERATDKQHAYHTRWQAWTAFLNGAAGYGCGSFGVWNFLDPDANNGETGKKTHESVPWKQAIEFKGTAQLQHVRSLLTTISWWEMQPSRKLLFIEGKPVTMPTADDISPPHAARTNNGEWVIYIPNSNRKKAISVKDDGANNLDGKLAAQWFDPRNGQRREATVTAVVGAEGMWRLPQVPSDDDWVLRFSVGQQVAQ